MQLSLKLDVSMYVLKIRIINTYIQAMEYSNYHLGFGMQ